MLKIGITGGMGSGKSTVCEVFELLGIPVYKSDERSKWLLENNKMVKESVVKLFGTQVLTKELQIDRKALGILVFGNKKKLEQLNALLHPAVAADFERWCLEKEKKHKIIIKEAAILYESGADKQVDKVIVVLAPLETRIERSMQRDGLTREQVLARMKNQWPQEELEKRSWKTIDNSGAEMVLPQCLYLCELLKKQA